MGNSEVGHLNIGAGRIVYQDFTRINLAIEKRELEKNPVLIAAIEEAKKNGAALHLLGLLSDGGVHSHNTHLYALLEMAKMHGLEKVYIHAILDGRDVPPKSAIIYFQDLDRKIKSIGVGRVATVQGRYYAMDRDRRWERTLKAYRAMTEGVGLEEESPEKAVLEGYERGETDEFLSPTIVDPEGLIQSNDSVIFFNFRPDRARQITRAFVDDDFKEFKRYAPRTFFVCMTQYDESISAPVAFQVEYLHETLGEVVSRAGKRQLRIAETEKYAHVTFFFNGGREEPYENEDRILIPSPKVATYDLQPEMSALQVTDVVVRKILENIYDLIVLNYANPDMVGHTGILSAAVKAVETVDLCVGRVVAEVLNQGGGVLLTADHGNAEQMTDSVADQPHTAHTTNPVPFMLIFDRTAGEIRLRSDGILADVAPTVLELLDLEIPDAMTGRSLISKNS
jgi:2,3-bisphosphoglycerate-independent phosphoglycerate mutase